MYRSNRRNFLGMTGGAAIASLYPGLIERALAIAPATRTGTLQDIDHIVVHMQENRAFDHYFGMLNGVRGLGDPRPLRLPGGRTAWAQPSSQHRDGYVLPYHGDSKTTRSFRVDGAGQSHQENIWIFNRGRYDRWGHTNELHNRMLHYTAGDLPFYYALADAFTVCDAYHCSTMTQTYPNRLHLFSGCNGGGTVGGDPEMDNYGESDTPSADMREDKPLRSDAYRWTTYAERLQQAGVSWKVYQEYDNFGDNLLSVFAAFRPCPPESDLYKRGRSWVSEHRQGPDRTRSDGKQLVAAFRDDVVHGRLPQISWIVTAADLSEHPQAEPAKGEHVTVGLIAALVDHPEVFARTAFLLVYDEAGGFFDHMPPPVPPVGDYRGYSSVPLDGETKVWGADAKQVHGPHPIGLGIRTPTVIVSPWSRGGAVCSQLFDHTSVLQFMEARFGVREPNISTWRRSVCGDLTSAFDFSTPNADTAAFDFPSTADFQQRVAQSAAGTANAIPDKQQPGRQMEGRRRHRTLPYRFRTEAGITDQGRLRIALHNAGKVGVTFTVHDNHDKLEPWHYTIGGGDSFASEQWHDDGLADACDLTLAGPNGYMRRYAGTLGAAASRLEAGFAEVEGERGAQLTLFNHGGEPANFELEMDATYAAAKPATSTVRVEPGKHANIPLPLAATQGWYDLTVTAKNDPAFLRRFAGKVDDGRDGLTDPGIGMMRVTA
ncbi:phosphocholine-specific phospholipase C [Novosphingobium album (ex Hu et al. 2023)]|uniref:phospholipase C n=1 Tax=Novosphingobium album (ex Hu et al. 2023) TaxID=2930093 RepID=A0ABT0AYD6_9SPHN|nr:phospholipase C, phosphocholine-specific [Novosphingobium album (ex Hu et al. 2023)]MCJ2177821.1 phospholipase C, phosphocholine-specific [Novosphingobium album (ex Hu et al. 2023)]